MLIEGFKKSIENKNILNNKRAIGRIAVKMMRSIECAYNNKDEKVHNELVELYDTFVKRVIDNKK